MPQPPRCRVRSAVLALLPLVLAGCGAIQQPHHAGLKEAQEVRSAALTRLARAITHYCTVATETVRARDACLVREQFSALDVEHIIATGQFLSPHQSAELIPPSRPWR